jgi:integrase
MVNWLLLSKKVPAAATKANGRSPTPEEVRTLLKHADRRLKVIVLLLCSSGIRVGAFPYLRKGHITPMYKWDYLIWKKRKLEKEGKFEDANKIVIQDEDKHVILAAKIITYPGEPEQRFTFISPEAYDALRDYMNFRGRDGEKITDDSVIIRDEWQTTDAVKRGRIGVGQAIQKESNQVRFKDISHEKKRSKVFIKIYRQV